jgi:hypothetical protein
MKTWVSLNPEEVSRSAPIRINGMEVNVYPSPYDVPVAMSGEYLKDMHVLRIQFSYPRGEEVLSERKIDDLITLGIGQESERLYRIDFKVDPEATQLPDNWSETFSRAVERLSTPDFVTKYQTARNCVAHHQGELFGSLVKTP